MLLRASSDAGARLRRSKSATTVHRVAAPVLDPLDPEVAHQHALAAAATAYVKAYGREMPGWDKGRAPEPSRSKPSSTRTSTEGRHFPPRGSSFRSTTSQKSSQRPKSSRLSTVAGPGADMSLPSYNASLADRTPMLQPSSAVVNENVRPSSQPKPYRSHVVSSIASQQIRKARSMYYASSVQTGSPIPRPQTKYLTTPPPHNTISNNSIRPSTPATGIASFPPPLPPVSASTHSESINKARDKVLQDFQQRPVRHTPSLFLAPFKKRHEKAKSKATQAQSTRESSCNSSTPVDSVVEASIAEFKPPKEKRSFSSSLRKRFKKVFGRSSSNTTSVPAQQVEASRDYFTEQGPRISPLPVQYGDLDVPSPDDDVLARVRSRTPSMEAGMHNRVRPGSGCSSRSDVDISNATTSRVTSWTTSSAGNTLTSRDLNRLSVIHEAKDSLASELNHPIMGIPKRKPPPIPSFAAFREPMPIEGLTEGASSPIDPKRVFSALMKEIGTTKPAPSSSTVPTLSTTEISDVFVSTPSVESRTAPSDVTMPGFAEPDTATATVTNPGLTPATKSTIRKVTPEPVEESLDRATSIRGAVRIPKPDVGDSASDSDAQDDNCSITQHTDKPRYRFNRDLLSTKAASPTSEHIRRRVETSTNRRRLPFEGKCPPASPRLTRNTLEVTNTPRSLRSRQPGATSATDSPPGFTSSTPPQDSMVDVSPSRKSRTLLSPLSPSVYSRNTDGMSIMPNESIGSLNQTGAEDGGTAVIITSRPVKSYVIGTPSPERRTHSTHSSKDWKAWLSHEVSELGSLPQEDITINRFHVGTGHQREPTQISENDKTQDGDSAMPRRLDEETLSHRDADVNISALPHVEKENGWHDANISATPPMASRMLETSPKLEDPSPTRQPHHPDQSPCPRLPLRSYCPSTSSDRPTSTRFSSISSDRQFIYRPRQEAQPPERMNERFPYIETGRRYSQTSSKTARTRRTTSTESPPLRSTPSPKVYSDFSVPSPSENLRPNPVYANPAGLIENDKENQRENDTACQVDAQSTPGHLARPKSLQVLTRSTWSVDSGNVAHVRASPHKDMFKSNSLSGITPPRHRLRPSNVSVGSLSVRPKSVFDLRPNTGAATPPPLTVHGSSKLGPHGSSPRTRYPVTIRQVETDAYPFPKTPSPRSSPRQPATPTPSHSLHLKRSSSTLALMKDPSPGLEERGIDAIIESEETPEVLKRVGTGTPTPGQRMAERFLRERKSGNMAGSPTRMSTAFL